MSKVWNEEKDEKLRELWGTIPVREMVPIIGACRCTIIAHAKKLDLPSLKSGPKLHRRRDKPRQRSKGIVRPWTPAEDADLRALAATMTKKELAARLKRTVSAIENRADRLGVKFTAGIWMNAAEDRGLRPRHVRGGVASPEWFESCNDAFCAAMEAAA